MRAHRQTRLAVAIVLLSLVWPAATHISSRPNALLALVLAISGTALLAPSFEVILSSLANAGVILALCGLSSVLLVAFAWRLHDIGLSLPGGRLSWLGYGLGPGPAPGTFTIWTGVRCETVRLTFEALGIYQIWFIVVALAGLALTSRCRAPWRSRVGSIVPAAFTIATYAVLRFAVLVVLAVEFVRPELLWKQPLASFSWLPLACALKVRSSSDRPLLGGYSPRRLWDGLRMRRGAGTNLARAVSLALVLVAGSLLAFAALFNDPGRAKAGRVLIDESHSNWEWTEQAFDTTAFGVRAEYNYYCLRAYLGHFYDVAASDRVLSDAALESVDVLVIKTPTAPYSKPEVDAIVRFVGRGGGLLLISDHTNLFGMSTYLNAIASRFGMGFRFDDTFDLETTGLSTYTRPRFLFHPAVRMLGQLGFLTSCSVRGDPGVEPVIVGYGLGSEDVDYGHPNFFGNIAYDLVDRFGLFLQAGARRYGQGRVLLFSDSTCFSNFCIFGPGRAQMALGFIDYLNRKGARYPRARLAALIGAGALIGLAVAAEARARSRVCRVPDADRASSAVPEGGSARRQPGDSAHRLRHAGILLVAGLALGTFATARMNARTYGPIRQRSPLPTVLFDTGHSGVSLFTYLGEAPDRRWQQFTELYLAVQRLGLFPCAGTCADLQQMRPLAVVVVNPALPFTRRETGELVQYVRGGGRLLLLDSVLNSASTANQVLGAFGMQALVGVADVSADSAGTITPALRIIGAESRSPMTHQGIEFCSKTVGKGSVIVWANSFSMSAAVLGSPLEHGQLTPQRLRAYRQVFHVLRRVLHTWGAEPPEHEAHDLGRVMGYASRQVTLSHSTCGCRLILARS